MDNNSVIIEENFKAPSYKVWNALTDKNIMKLWYFEPEQFEARKGFKFSFEGGTERRKYIHHCEVVDVIPQKKLSYTWRYEGIEGNSLVTFYLGETQDGTLLRLVHEGLDTFPADNADLRMKNFEEGWRQIISISLKNFLGY